MLEKISVAIIGAAGWIGGVHAECWQRAQILNPEIKIELKMAVDIFEEPLKKVAEKFSFASWSINFEDAIADPSIDVIDICCSNNMHKEIAVKAAAAGKSIFCEKPIAMDIKEAKEMIEAADINGVATRINFMYRKYPSLVYIKQLIENGDLGELRHLRIMFEQDVFCDSSVPYSWRMKKATSGGGAIVTMGSHIIDLARFLMGDIQSVMGHTTTHVKERPLPDHSGMGVVDVDDMTMSLVNYKNGATGEIFVSWMTHGRKHHLEFQLTGSKGTIIFNSERLNEIQFCEGESEHLKRGFKTILIGSEHPYGQEFSLKTGMGIGAKESFVLQISDFIKDILNGTHNGPEFMDGYINIVYIQKIQESSETRSWVDIPEI